MNFLVISSVILMLPKSSSTEIEIYRKDSNCTALDPVVNGFVNTSQSEYQQGDVIQVACNDGYEPHYTNTAQCREFGIIQFTPFTCKIKTCTVPTILSNGFINPFPNTDGLYTINTTITFTCKQNFTLIGVRTMKCLGNNRWAETGTSVCLSDSYMYEFALKKIHEETVKTCALSPMVANAYATPNPDSNNRFPVNTTVTITCEESFMLIGKNTMKCLDDGKWTEEAPFCLASSYTWWYNIGLVAICVTLFIVAIVLISVILCQRHKPLKQTIQPTLTNRDSLAESGIDVNEKDEDESSPMINNVHLADVRQTVIDEKDIHPNDSAYEKEVSHPVRPVDVIPSAPPPKDCNPESIHNTNYTYNIFGNVTHQTENIKAENNDDKNGQKPDRKQPEDEHVPEKTPTEESQTTVVALQETEDGTCKGAKPIIE
ncbi:P-selectin-like [Mercenaria mercenaria]|uniref:P-selectin-like n=1 Tax=Mercenaria mercenaria TaxID=6596 RepID=UPI00234E4B92|nr:P-selectin-like [Mercenaria mercenaria]